MQWEVLEPTDQPGVRHCDSCNESIHMVRTSEEISVAALFKRCVAIADENNLVMFVGSPSTDWVAPVNLNVAMRLTRRPTLVELDSLGAWYPSIMNEDGVRSMFLEQHWIAIGRAEPRELQLMRNEAFALQLPVEFRAGAPQPVV